MLTNANWTAASGKRGTMRSVHIKNALSRSKCFRNSYTAEEVYRAH